MLTTSRAALIASLALIVLGGSCGGDDGPAVDVGLPTKEMSAEDSAFIDKAATDMVEGRLFFVKGELPGLWVGIWDPEKGVHVRGYGKAVIGGRDADADDFVRIASITKTFVATVVLQLVGEGRLRLSDTVEQHLPGLVARFPELRGLTVRQLLSMKSGLPDFYEAWVAELAREPTRAVPATRMIELALRDPVAPPGTAAYSNTNYIVLGELVEAVSGTPLPELIADRVTEPLGIEDARLPPNEDTSLPEPAAHGYAFGCDAELEALGVREGADLTERSVSGALAAGGMYARFSDLGVWGASVLGNDLLPPALASQRLRAKPAPSVYGWYGLGISGTTGEFRGGSWVGHGGGIPGWQSLVVHNQETGATAAIVTTTCGVDVDFFDVFLHLYPR